MRTSAAFLALLAPLAVAACNTPPKDPPRDGAEGPAAQPDAETAKALTTAPAATALPTTPAPSVAATAPSAAAAASSSPKTDASAPPAGKGCATDADCRTFASYCAEAPCACRILAKTEGDPKCLGSGAKVSCFVDPCKNKVAHCASGACVLTAKGSTEK